MIPRGPVIAIILACFAPFIQYYFQSNHPGKTSCDARQIGIILIGPGSVGRQVLHHLRINENDIEKSVPQFRFGCKASVRVVSIGDSSGYIKLRSGFTSNQLLSIEEHKRNGFELISWNDDTEIEIVSNLRKLINDLSDHGAHFDKYIAIDCTATDKLINDLLHARQNGFGIVLANKKPLTDTHEMYQKLIFEGKQQDPVSRDPFILYEATVGAGLPVIHTIRRMVASGDRIYSIQGVFSGTLGYILGEMKKGSTFSEAVSSAYENGYTEPDPREDLSGKDVARKALILARELGWKRDMSSITLHSMYPSNMTSLSKSEFLSQISALDNEYQLKMQVAEQNNQIPVYLATISEENIEIGLTFISLTTFDAWSQLHETENLVEIQSTWYYDKKLIMKGPGAGVNVTASAVLADTLEIACLLYSSCIH